MEKNSSVAILKFGEVSAKGFPLKLIKERLRHGFSIQN